MRVVLRLMLFSFLATMTASGLAHGQTIDSLVEVDVAPGAPEQQPAGPPPTPRHTGIKAMALHLVTNFKYLPSKENLLWAGTGGGLALAAHPFDDDVNRELVGNDTAENIFKTGEILRSEERRVGK